MLFALRNKKNLMTLSKRKI